MSMSMLYLICCLIIAMGSYYATFVFAKNDWPARALFFFIIGSSAFGSATALVSKEPVLPRANQEQTQPR